MSSPSRLGIRLVLILLVSTFIFWLARPVVWAIYDRLDPRYKSLAADASISTASISTASAALTPVAPAPVAHPSEQAMNPGITRARASTGAGEARQAPVAHRTASDGVSTAALTADESEDEEGEESEENEDASPPQESLLDIVADGAANAINSLLPALSPPSPPMAPSQQREWAYAWRMRGSAIAAEIAKTGAGGGQTGGPAVTAEQVEGALAAIGPAPEDGPCAGTAGGWCRAFLDQPAVNIPVGAPPPDKPCPGGCSGNGICHAASGMCMCPAWWSGPSCAVPFLRKCQSRSNPQTVSRCPGVCDERMGHCYCPSSTPYGGLGGRPLGDDCVPNRYEYFVDTNGYTRTTEEAWDGAGMIAAVGTKLPGNRDPAVLFGDPAKHTGVTQPGWCVAHPSSEAAKICPCHHDGTTGRYCDIPTQHVCPADCSGRGTCEHGYCWCTPGYYGNDCGYVTAAKHAELAAAGTPYLTPGEVARSAAAAITQADADAAVVIRKVNVAEKIRLAAAGDAAMSANHTKKAEPGGRRLHAAAPATPPAAGVGLPGVVGASRLRRPLIFVYELPKEMNIQIMQYRWDVGTCAHRRFDAKNGTEWKGAGGYMELELHETLLVSPHRTLDPEAADWFYVPLYLTCFIWPVANFANQPKHKGPNRQGAPIDLILGALKFIQGQPYWARNHGRDHLWYFAHDEGACWAPADVWSGVMLSHWGRMDIYAETPVSSSAFASDNYDNSPDTLRIIGNHPCFDPDKDIVIPPLTYHWSAPRERAKGPDAPRSIFFYFAGNDGSTRDCKTPAKCYSRGVRQQIKRLFAKAPGFEFTSHGGSYSELLSRSTFCLVAPGDGFGTRFEDAVLHGCIPVIVMDNTLQPWGTLMDVDSFSVRVPQDRLTDLEKILRAVLPEVAAAKRAAAYRVLSRYEWTGLWKWPWRGAPNTMDPVETLMAALYHKQLMGGGARGLKLPGSSKPAVATARRSI